MTRERHTHPLHLPLWQVLLHHSSTFASVSTFPAHTILKDNRRMLMLGVSYNFFSGKKKNIRKNINNYDSDAGAFK